MEDLNSNNPERNSEMIRDEALFIELGSRVANALNDSNGSATDDDESHIVRSIN